MRIFQITTTETLRRAHRVAASSAAEAEKALRASLRPGQRIVESARLVDHHVTAASGEEAIARLLGTDYVDCNGKAMKVEDWVLDARRGVLARERANAVLAPIGLRISEHDSLWIASADCVPGLGLIFEGTQWAGAGLRTALGALDGAEISRHPLTFAGRRARATALPLSNIFAVQPQEASA